MSRYHVKEIYFTLQGEGAQSGRAAVFCRFTGCNLWSGQEKDRANAKCYFCDTDFITPDPSGGRFESSDALSGEIEKIWTARVTEKHDVKRFVVFTGGEPLLQLDSALLKSVKQNGFQIAVETNGTIVAPEGIDWLTVSPKPNSELLQITGDELKLVYPHEVIPEQVAHLPFTHFFLSPLAVERDPEQTQRNIEQTVAYCETHPQWRLSLQSHKFIGIR